MQVLHSCQFLVYDGNIFQIKHVSRKELYIHRLKYTPLPIQTSVVQLM